MNRHVTVQEALDVFIRRMNAKIELIQASSRKVARPDAYNTIRMAEQIGDELTLSPRKINDLVLEALKRMAILYADDIKHNGNRIGDFYRKYYVESDPDYWLEEYSTHMTQGVMRAFAPKDADFELSSWLRGKIESELLAHFQSLAIQYQPPMQMAQMATALRKRPSAVKGKVKTKKKKPAKKKKPTGASRAGSK